ncbi:hypothetical protein [Mucilaginibacter sp. 22184]|uniref:hypothetical protein n=1 Tax=Mucilaginibacter sp. 22184 TaxID=3453887 RepID=UPI003F8470B0
MNYLSKYAAIYAVVTLLAIQSLAQSSAPDFNSKIIPLSPAMATFQRFGDYPVDYSMGLAQISIPVYTIRQGSFSFPININFHASGRRSALDFSSMGVGWALNATGYISREIRERPDDLYNNGLEMTVDQVSNNPDYTQGVISMYNTLRPVDMMIPNPPGVGRASRGDAEHDIYSYNVNGISGKFIIDKSGKIVPLTFTNLKISGSRNGPFVITDPNGIIYNFDINSSSNEYTTLTIDGFQGNYLTGLYLSRITLPSGRNISFAYVNRWTDASGDNIVSPYSSSSVLLYRDKIYTASNNSTGTSYGTVTSNYSTRSYMICYLQTITFSEGKVNLSYDNTNLLLNNISIVDVNNNLTEKSNFTYVATPGTLSNLSNNNAVSLSTVYKTDVNNNVADKYSLTYYDNQLTNSDQAFKYITTCDWWGYVNSNGNKFPVDISQGQESVEVAGYGCSNCKTPAFPNKVSGMLKTITYPTGGSTEFDYEPNYYGNNTEGPGIRIQKIISDDGSGVNKLTRYFKYGENENGNGFLPCQPDPMDFRSDQTVLDYQSGGGGCSTCFVGSHRERVYTTNPVAGMAEAYQKPIYYSAVTEYQQSALGASLGKTIYHYSLPQFDFSSNPPKSFREKYWTNSKLTYKEVFKYRSQQNDYFKIEQEGTSYQTFNYLSIPQIRMFRNIKIPYDDNGNSFRTAEESYILTNTQQGGPYIIYFVKDYPIETAVELPIDQTKTTWDDSGNTLTTETKLFYDNLVHLQPTRTETFLSKDEKLIVETKYPSDYTSANPVGDIWKGIVNMNGKNIITPVERSQYRSAVAGTNKRLISSQLLAYNPLTATADSIMLVESAVSLTDFTPSAIQSGTFVNDGRYRTRYIFDKYDDELNLLQKHQKFGSSTVYVWTYNGKYPIAEITNATYNDVESVLGGATAVKSFRDNTNPTDAAVINFLLPLRNSALLKNAQVTTYTYDPLIGMTSMTDAKGETTYYEYDGFQRLMNVKDKDGNILKHMDYHYQGQ